MHHNRWVQEKYIWEQNNLIASFHFIQRIISKCTLLCHFLHRYYLCFNNRGVYSNWFKEARELPQKEQHKYFRNSKNEIFISFLEN